MERGRNLKRPHFLSNANTALQFLQSKKVSTRVWCTVREAAGKSVPDISRLTLCSQIKLVNINSSDLVDGRPPVVLGLIWTIILYFQVLVFALTNNAVSHVTRELCKRAPHYT